MNTNKIIFALSLMALAFFALSLTQVKTFNESNDSGLTYHAVVNIYKNGELIYQGHNTVVNGGKNLVKTELAGQEAGITDIRRLAIGNTTTPAQDVSDTALGQEIVGCGLTNTTGLYVNQPTANGQWNVTNTFQSTCNGVVVNSTALYNNTVGGTLFAETTFTSTTLNVNDQINVTWGIYLS